MAPGPSAERSPPGPRARQRSQSAETASGLGGKFFYFENIDSFENPTTSNDQYGASLAAADYIRPGHAELAIGIPYKDLAHADQGAVEIRIGAPSGFDVTVRWNQDSTGVPGVGGQDDHWGAGLTTR